MAGCKPNCCTQPRAAPWENDVALIKVSRSEMSCKRGQSSLLGLPSAADIMKRATCFMRGNAPCGVKGVMGYALSARGIFANAKMPNVSIAVYVPPGRCPGLWATFGLTARPNSFTKNRSFSTDVFLTFSAVLGIARTSSALRSPCTNVVISDKTERNIKFKNDKTERKSLSISDKTERKNLSVSDKTERNERFR